MTSNAAKEARYKDAAKLFWQFACENLSYVKSATMPSDDDSIHLDLYL